MSELGLAFDWDAANLDHIARHNVTREETEQAILGDPLDIEMQIAEDGSGEERLQHLGETAQGRIPATDEQHGATEKVRVISAWDAPKALKLYYLAEMRRLDGDTEDSEV